MALVNYNPNPVDALVRSGAVAAGIAAIDNNFPELQREVERFVDREEGPFDRFRRIENEIDEEESRLLANENKRRQEKYKSDSNSKRSHRSSGNGSGINCNL